MLMRFDPFRDSDASATQNSDPRARAMPLDAYRDGDVFHVDVDLPGCAPESIEVTAEKNVVTIAATRQWDCEDADVVVCERPQGTFTRSLFLGEGLDAEKITANSRDGVLRLTIPVAEQAKARRIGINTGTPVEAAATSSSS